MKNIIENLAAEALPIDVAVYWKQCCQFLPSDKDFDMDHYHEWTTTLSSALVLAVDSLMAERLSEAVYILLYAAFTEEVLQSGPSFMRRFFEDEHLRIIRRHSSH